MKHLYLLLLFTFYVLLTNAQCEKEKFALYELFTSEGCSSCPPEDDRFNTKVKTIDFLDLNVVMVAHHVDSWDSPFQGAGPCGVSSWDDPYSDPEAFTLQKRKVVALGSNVFITPHIFIQGRYASSINLSKANIDNRINSSLAETPKSGVCIEHVSSAKFQNENTITFNYTLIDSENNGSEELVYFVYEDKLSNEITAGENCNLTLHHERVRRNLMQKSIDSPSDKTGTLTISFPTDANIANVGVSAYLQDTTTMQAVGGTKGFMLNNYVTSTSDYGIEEYGITVYPNPASQQVNVNLGLGMDYIEILDLTGKIVQSKYGIQNSSYTLDLTEEITPGMYIFKVGSQFSLTEQKVGKLIIK